MTSHYPDSATLAAFRRRIDPDMIDCQAWNGTAYHSQTGIDGATSHEREHGIGYRAATPVPGSWGLMHTVVRREASAMRSRAYARMRYEQARAMPDCGSTFFERQAAWNELRRLGISAEYEPDWSSFFPGTEPRPTLPIARVVLSAR
jgi:hypothetical protein